MKKRGKDKGERGKRSLEKGREKVRKNYMMEEEKRKRNANGRKKEKKTKGRGEINKIILRENRQRNTGEEKLGARENKVKKK